MSDYTVMVREQAKVFLGGPPLVKMATGEESDDESLGGAEMHARTSGLADYLAEDERDAIRIGRRIVARLNWRKATPEPTAYAEPDARPRRAARPDPDRPQGAVRPARGDRPDLRRRLGDQRAGLRRVQAALRTSLVTGWARLHGRPIGILANAQGVLFSEEAQKATQFVQLANQTDTPLLFLHNTTGYMVGKEYEQGGIIKHGAMMINAISNSTVPHLTVIMGASYGAGNYGMNGRAFDPRFLFTWPSAKSAVMGPAQLAGVLEIVARQSAEAKGEDLRRRGLRRASRRSSRRRSRSSRCRYFLSGMLYDDGVIDPRDTRTVLGICLSVIDNTAVPRHRPLRGLRVTDDHQTPGRQPRRDREPGLPHLPRRSASRPSPCTPTPTPTCPTSARPTTPSACRATRPPTPTCAPTSDRRRAPLRAPTRSTPATASSPRTPTSRGPCSTPG